MKKEITTKDDIVNAVEANHIWLNAFNCINPTPEFCEQLGRQILNMLDRSENLLPLYLGEESEPIQASIELAKLTKMLYLSINKS